MVRHIPPKHFKMVRYYGVYAPKKASKVREMMKAQRKRVEELSILHSIAQTIAAVTDLPEALKVVAETMPHLFDAEVTLITVPAAEDSELYILAGFRRSTTPLATAPPVFPLSEMPATRQGYGCHRSC